MRGEDVPLAQRRWGAARAPWLLRGAVLAAWLGAASSSQGQGRASARPDADALEAQRTVQALSDRFVQDDFAGVVALLDLTPFRLYVREVADRLRPLPRSAREMTVAELKAARPGLTDDQAWRELEMLRLTTPPDGMPSPTTREFGGMLGVDSLGIIPLDTLARRWLSVGAGGPTGFQPAPCPPGRKATRLTPSRLSIIGSVLDGPATAVVLIRIQGFGPSFAHADLVLAPEYVTLSRTEKGWRVPWVHSLYGLQRGIREFRCV